MPSGTPVPPSRARVPGLQFRLLLIGIRAIWLVPGFHISFLFTGVGIHIRFLTPSNLAGENIFVPYYQRLIFSVTLQRVISTLVVMGERIQTRSTLGIRISRGAMIMANREIGMECFHRFHNSAIPAFLTLKLQR